MRYKYDENNFYVETVYGKEIENTTDIRPQDGLYKAKFTGAEWVETLTQAEINVLNNVVTEPTLEERVSAVEEVILNLL